MQNRYQALNDLYFTEAGDFSFERGDLADTKKHNYRTIAQKITTVMKSARGDWKKQPTLGAALPKALGLRNSQSEARRIQSRIVAELIKDSTISSRDLSVVVFPQNEKSLGVIVEIASPNGGKPHILNFTYEMSDNRTPLRA